MILIDKNVSNRFEMPGIAYLKPSLTQDKQLSGTKTWTVMKKACKVCDKPFRGRSDKLYCSQECKNKWNNAKRKQLQNQTALVDRLLHRNRAILALFLPSSESKKKIDRLALEAAGFKFNICTGIYQTQNGNEYFQLYEFAWLEISAEMVLVVRRG